MSKLLEVCNFSLDLISNYQSLPLLQNINFSINKGEIFSLVGESGCGKSVCSMALTKILAKNLFSYKTGSIKFEGDDILKMNFLELQKIRSQKISYIFQDPFSALNPIKKIKHQIIESHLINGKTKKEALEKAKYLLNQVGISDVTQRLESYPNQMSGGMLQRICIAMALMSDPILLIADEPTSAIDVTIQAQLVELLLKLKEENHMTILFISHDLGLVNYLSDRIGVMYAGQMVEIGGTEKIIQKPKHPYTFDLIQTVPTFLESRKIESIDGIVPTPLEFPKGCHYNTRCKRVIEECFQTKPKLEQIEENRKVACFKHL